MKEFNFEEFIDPYRVDLIKSGPSRYHNYEWVIKRLVAKNKPLVIVETGTMWSGLEDNQGAFTLVFADLIKNWTGGRLITIDISADAIASCKRNTADHSTVIEYVTSDSVSYLESLTDEEVAAIDYIYFDSYDLWLPDPTPSQLHHYRELAAVYKRLGQDVIISVDDNYLPNTWVEWIAYNSNGELDSTRCDIGTRIIGKGTLIDLFLLQEGWNRYDDFLHVPPGHMLTYVK